MAMLQTQHHADQPLNLRRLRHALGDACHGMTANAFSSVSLVPPLVLVCIRQGSRGGREITRNGRFAVNILHAEQEHLSRHFASADRPRSRDALRGVPHTIIDSESAILDGVAGYLDCRLVASHGAGDHTIFLGEVTESHVESDASPLVFYRGSYRRIA
jgi:flavin reductase (DIM6/NTAB) family NADH-FMN oxidoreductase RutF